MTSKSQLESMWKHFQEDFIMNRHSRIFLSPPHMSGREELYIKEAFASNWVAPLGPNVTAFEKEVAAYAGVKGALAVSSGTSAIHLAVG